MTLEELRDLLRVGDVTLDAQAQGLEALGEQEGVERGAMAAPVSRSHWTRALSA